MPIPTGLFVESPEMNDVSLTKLNQDANEWPEEIVEKVKERITECSGMNLVVKFMKKDEENGAATGSVVVGSASKVAVIPIIVKDFFLYPLDVMIADGKLLPLTPDYFMTVFQGDKNKAFQRLDEYPMYSGLHRFEDASLWQANTPPSGRYSYASAGADILDQISGTIDPTEFKRYLASNPLVAANFAKHAHVKDIVKALTKLSAKNSELQGGKNNMLATNIAVLRLEGPNRYSVLSSMDDVFAPTSVAYANRAKMREMLAEISAQADEVLNEVDRNGEKVLVPPMAERGPMGGITAALDSHRDMVEYAKEFANYRVHKKDGVSVEGVVVPTVISFDMKKLPLKIFLGKTMATIQGEIAGIKLTNANRHSPLKPDQSPAIGRTGTFVYMSEKNRALATVPVTIRAVEDNCGDLNLKCVDLLGKPLNIRMCCQANVPSAPVDSKGTPGGQIFDDYQRIVPTKDGYILPRKFFWVPMEGFQEVSSNPVDYMAKVAALGKSIGDNVMLIPTGYGQYSLQGADKYAKAANWDKTNLSSAQVKLALACFGHPEDRINSMLKLASKSVTGFVISGCKFPKIAAEKDRQNDRRKHAAEKLAGKLRVNLVKEASYLENAQTVDALLSLNFINPDNLAKFVGFLPRLKATVSNLCSLLLAARVGVQEIPEAACSNSMYRLIDVINGLEKLRAVQEMGAQE